ncbi:DUF1854 domain-containing protein [Pigmentiphaga soli]|uniref:DUF1854 domain-containing protein n=1 Tax=Pigmentiphaga soli TaxID=1007095 RepID=A0ABP8HLM5_9BURK
MNTVEPPPGRLARNAFGRLVWSAPGAAGEEVVPVRAFPLGDPDGCIALVNAAGRELAWIERLDALPEAMRRLVSEELAGRDFMPGILRIVSVSGYATPCTWQVETDRGPAVLSLRSEQDIRRVAPSSLLIADGNGLHFLVRDVAALDRASRRLLDRFL